MLYANPVCEWASVCFCECARRACVCEREREMTTNLLPSQLPAIKGPPQLEVLLPNLHEQPLPVNITITNLMLSVMPIYILIIHLRKYETNEATKYNGRPLL